jgi:hypothetical protein
MFDFQGTVVIQETNISLKEAFPISHITAVTEKLPHVEGGSCTYQAGKGSVIGEVKL